MFSPNGTLISASATTDCGEGTRQMYLGFYSLLSFRSQTKESSNSSVRTQLSHFSFATSPQWGVEDAEVKVISDENTELKRSPFKVWSRLVYSLACYAYCQKFLPFLFLPSESIHLHFFPKPLPISPVLALANTWFLCRPAE